MNKVTAGELARQAIRAAIIGGLITGETAALLSYPEVASVAAWMLVEVWWLISKRLGA